MSEKPEQTAGRLLNGEQARILQENSGSLKALAESPEGKKVQRLLGDEQKVARALERGDQAELKRMMQTVLGTDEGRKLMEQLKGLLR
jgi:hypothetical protein